MKHKYLTPEFISDIKLSPYGTNYNSCRNRSIRRGDSALLVLDMQECFTNPSFRAYVPSSDYIVPQIDRLIKTYLSYDAPIYLTRHLNSVEDAGMMSKWWSELILESNPLSEIVPELAKYNLPVINKSQYDAFHGTDLERRLLNDNIKQVVITGVMTHLCCETTARSAFMRGFEVFFTADGAATYNEQFHRASLLNLSHGFASIVTVNQVINGIKLSSKDA